MANNFFYIGDDALGAFFSVVCSQRAWAANQRRMAWVVGFDGANLNYCRNYANWSETQPLELNENQVLVLAPGLSATAQPLGQYSSTVVQGDGAAAQIVANLEFTASDSVAAMPAALTVLGLDLVPGLTHGPAEPGWLTALGGATGNSASMTYTISGSAGTTYGIAIVHIAETGNGMVWNIYSNAQGAELSLLGVLNPGYCERNAPNLGACPVPLPG